jgi:hypothetical protein
MKTCQNGHIVFLASADRTTCPHCFASLDVQVNSLHTSGMMNGMTSARTSNVRRLLGRAFALSPAERALLVRELLGPEGLYGASEAADRLNVLQPNLRPIPGLPTPVGQLRCGSVWLREEVDEFAKQRVKRPLPPPAPAAA